MTISYDDAVAQITAPGERFETTVLDLGGIPTTVFKNAPNSLRDIFGAARGYGDDLFLVYEDERLSFNDVMAQVDALGAALVERYGVRKGDRVAIGMRNFPEWVIAFAAITSIGAISVSLNAWWTEDEMDFALEDCGASVLIADEERVERGLASCNRLGTRIVGVRMGASVPDGVDRYEDVVVAGTPMPEVAIDPDDDATILYTSGTTGRPKGAVSTHRAVVQALLGFGCRAAVERLRRPDAPAPSGAPAFILVVPLFHVTGCIPVMMSCFASGLKLVMMRKWDPERALELIERERVTNFVGVPTQSWDLLESPSFATTDTSSLVSVGGGGAPAPPQLVKRVSSNFAKASPGIGYGMTETNAYGPQNSGVDSVDPPTTGGGAPPTLLGGARAPEGRGVPPGGGGEICLRAPTLTRGYGNRPDATAET